MFDDDPSVLYFSVHMYNKGKCVCVCVCVCYHDCANSSDFLADCPPSAKVRRWLHVGARVFMLRSEFVHPFHLSACVLTICHPVSPYCPYKRQILPVQEGARRSWPRRGWRRRRLFGQRRVGQDRDGGCGVHSLLESSAAPDSVRGGKTKITITITFTLTLTLTLIITLRNLYICTGSNCPFLLTHT